MHCACASCMEQKWAGLDMAAKQMCYPANKCFYTKLELSYLALCLGFPSNFFTSVLRSNSEPAVYTVADINVLFENGSLKQTLNNTFNRYDDTYNIKTIKRVMCLLRHKKMTFGEVSTSRVAFELHSCENGSGMLAEVNVVMDALKMLERVISPTRLDAEIQKQQHYCDFPTRIQIYEFLCLVVLCEKAEEVQKSIPDTCTTSTQMQGNKNTDDLSLPDFNRLLMTTDQKVTDYLEHSYKQSLYKKVTPTPVVTVSKHTVSSATRRDQVFTAKEQFRCFTPSLEHSQLQLHQARNGVHVFTGEQYRTVEGKCTPLNRTMTSMSQTVKEPLKLKFRRTPVRVKDNTKCRKITRPSSSDSESIESLFQQSVEATPLYHDHTPLVADRYGHQHKSVSGMRHRRATSEGGQCFKPLVTSQDISRYQAKMRELEWITMRRETRQSQQKKEAMNLRSTSHHNTGNGMRVQRSTSRCRSRSETLIVSPRKSRTLPVVMSFSELPIFKTMVQHKQHKTAS